MPGAELIRVSGQEILYIDYSGCKPAEMLTVFNRAKDILLTMTGDCLLLTNFGRCYITPMFMRYAEKEMLIVSHLIKKNSFIGMTLPQQMILKGFRFFIGKDHYAHFDTREEAIKYLLSPDPVNATQR